MELEAVAAVDTLLPTQIMRNRWKLEPPEPCAPSTSHERAAASTHETPAPSGPAPLQAPHRSGVGSGNDAGPSNPPAPAAAPAPQ
mmetsp:Transcript_6400/g.16691  ORF Transcript_6400/g.16691 Transcript_6400/m.16691 type:complete len:85 (+) Transcript_6400:82-336(+)